MNILLITQLYPQPDDYGDNKPTKTVEYFAKQWVKEGHSVVVMHCSSKFPFLFYLIPPFIKNRLAGATSNIFPPLSSRRKLYREENGIRIYRFPMLKMLPGREYSQKALKKQSDIICNILDIKGFRPDLVAGHFANPSTELVANIALYYGAMSSIVFHGDCNAQTIQRYRLCENVKNIRAIGTRSIVEAKQVKGLLNLDTLPFVCYSGVPTSAFEDAVDECSKHDFSQGIKFLYVGSFIRRKHVDTVIKAFDSVADQKDTLTIVGGGPEEKFLKNIAKKCKHSKQIHFTGKVERDTALQLMKESHIFTLVSTGEVFGMVYIEAMLQGCITIASKRGGFDGIIIDGDNGFICHPEDENMLVSVYKKIQGMNAETLNIIGNKAIKTALRYSEKEVADKYLEDICSNQK